MLRVLGSALPSTDAIFVASAHSLPCRNLFHPADSIIASSLLASRANILSTTPLCCGVCGAVYSILMLYCPSHNFYKSEMCSPALLHRTYFTSIPDAFNLSNST